MPDLRRTLPGVGGGGGEGVGAPGLPAGGLAGQSSPVLHELKVISSSRTWYKPNQAKMPKGAVGRVEEKLISLRKIAGIVLGNFGEVSQATHSLLAALASSRVRVAGVTRGIRVIGGLKRVKELWPSPP